MTHARSERGDRAGRVRRMETFVAALNRLLSRPTVRLFGAGIGVVGAIAVGAAVVWWISNGFLAGDTVNYWLAGQRINVGHELYAVRPDDPAVPGLEIRPYGLYSPPLIAVPWRLLAAMPGISGMTIWWVAMAFCAIWVIAAVLLATRGWAGLVVLPLIPSIALLIGVANIDAAVIAGALVAWMCFARGRESAGGVLVGVLASLKLTPAVFLIWLIATRRWRALGWAIATSGVLAIVAMLAISPDIFFQYLGVVAGVSSGGRPFALPIAAAGAFAIMLVGRRRPIVAWIMAAFLMPLGSPVTANHTWALLLIAFAPATGSLPGEAPGERVVLPVDPGAA
jgi:Glycosyltransferase family 87